MSENVLEPLVSSVMGRPGMSEVQQGGCLPGMTATETASLAVTSAPLYSQGLLTVEQLSQVSVDADIQAAVSDFLRGLSTQMFARIVRNGSAEVGRWLGAKIQGERDGWGTRLRMAMHEIEAHRKHALQWQAALLHASEQLAALLDFLRGWRQDADPYATHGDLPERLNKLLDAIVECCAILLEDRVECCDALGRADPPPASVASVLKDALQKLEEEKETLKDTAARAEAESSKVRDENARMLEEVTRAQEDMRNKQTEMEALKSQVKEIGTFVKTTKPTTADKCVETGGDFRCLKTIADGESWGQGRASTQPHGANALLAAAGRENMFTQTARQPTLIEISEEKLRVLKDRAKKLEHSLHDAIASMDRLNTGLVPDGSSARDAFSLSSLAATSSKPRPPKVSSVQNWITNASFEVTNGSNSSTNLAGPRASHVLRVSDRKCFSERPPSKVPAASDDGDPSNKGRAGENRKLSRSRGAQVAKCLRCQKLFTATDNHKLACCFHSKEKERMEVYTDGGRLLRVQYVWKCCSQQAETDGCCYGHHI